MKSFRKDAGRRKPFHSQATTSGKTQGGAGHSTARQQRVERRRAAQAIPQPGNNEWKDAGRRKPFHSQATTSGKTQGGASHSTARQQRVERRRAAQAIPQPGN